METSKHPFRVQQLEAQHNGYDWPTFAIRDANNHCIARVGDIDRATASHNEANAKLFADAPRMRARIKELEFMLGRMIESWSESFYKESDERLINEARSLVPLPSSDLMSSSIV